MQRTFLASIGVLAVLLGGILLGRFAFAPTDDTRTIVNSQAILTALRDQGFLVTQTYVFDQPVTIKKTTGSAISLSDRRLRRVEAWKRILVSTSQNFRRAM